MRGKLVAIGASTILSACVVYDDVGHNGRGPEEEPRIGDMPGGTIVVAPRVLLGEEGGALGRANAFVGDLDGDGFDEFVLIDSEGRGKTYLFYGGQTIEKEMPVQEADAIFEGGSGSVRGVGDLDRDGLDDFAFVGAGQGIGHLVYGSSTRLEGQLDAAAVSTSITSPTGYRGQMLGVESAGDVNGDGYGDLLVEVKSGSIVSHYLVYSGSERFSEILSLEDAGALFRGRTEGKGFGLGAAAAGDVNGDGYSDLLVTTQDGQPRPRIALYYGGAKKITGAMSPADAEAGFDMPSSWPTMKAIGDLDGDGIDDLAIPSPRSIRFFYGKQTNYEGTYTPEDAAFSLEPEGDNGSLADPRAGFTGMAAGDVDADGSIDILIGDSHQRAQAGSLYMVLGARHRFDLRHRLNGDDALLYGKNRPQQQLGDLGEDLGYGVASGGDINGDGYDDILAGAPGHVTGGLDGGRVYLILGGPRAEGSECVDCEPVTVR